MQIIIDYCAKTILSQVEWRAGDGWGEYLGEEALGDSDDDGWEDTTPLIEMTADLERYIREMRPTVEDIMAAGSNEWCEGLAESEMQVGQRRSVGQRAGSSEALGTSTCSTTGLGVVSEGKAAEGHH